MTLHGDMFGDALILVVSGALIVAHWLTMRQFGEQMSEIKIKLARLEIQLETVRAEVRPELIEGYMTIEHEGRRAMVKVWIRPTRWR